MTEEQIKFYFNHIYRFIGASKANGVVFGSLVDYATLRKMDDDTFLAILDQMESSGLIFHKGETYFVALEKA